MLCLSGFELYSHWVPRVKSCRIISALFKFTLGYQLNMSLNNHNYKALASFSLWRTPRFTNTFLFQGHCFIILPTWPMNGR